MRITFEVSRRRALLAGIDAPKEITIDIIKPEALDQSERQALADSLDGSGERSNIVLGSPDMDGFLAALAERVEIEQASWDRRDEHARQVMDAPRELENCAVGLHANGKPNSYGPPVVSTTYSAPVMPFLDPHSPHLKELAKAYIADILAQRERLRNLAIESLRPQWEAWREQHEAQQRANAAAYDALYAQLPETMRERDKAGYAGADEITGALCELARSEAGYGPETASDGDWEQLETLTDSQWVEFRRAAQEAPEGSTVVPASYVDEDDNPFGGVFAVVRWCVGDLHVEAHVRLDAE